MSRRSSYFVINLILPTAFISFVGLMTFILPPGSGEKVGASIKRPSLHVDTCTLCNDSLSTQPVLCGDVPSSDAVAITSSLSGEPGGDCSAGEHCYSSASVRQSTRTVSHRASAVWVWTVFKIRTSALYEYPVMMDFLCSLSHCF